jgi:hypothetical protein
MAQVRAALGADALILANRRRGSQVEITAAAMSTGSSMRPRVTASVRRSRVTGNELQMKALERELHRLRGMLEGELARANWRDSARRPAPQATVLQRLRRLGLSRGLAGAYRRWAASPGPRVALAPGAGGAGPARLPRAKRSPAAGAGRRCLFRQHRRRQDHDDRQAGRPGSAAPRSRRGGSDHAWTAIAYGRPGAARQLCRCPVPARADGRGRRALQPGLA